MYSNILHFLADENLRYLKAVLDKANCHLINDQERGYLLFGNIPLNLIGDKSIPLDEREWAALDRIDGILWNTYFRQKETGKYYLTRNIAEYIRLIESFHEQKKQRANEKLRLLDIKRSILDPSASLSNSVAESIIRGEIPLDEEFHKVLSKKTQPDSSLSFENYKQLKEILNESLSLNDLEYYSSYSEEAESLWENKIIEESNSGSIQSLSPHSINFLLQNEHITIEQTLKYFLDKEEYSWDDIKSLVGIMLKNQDYFNDISSLLERLDKGLARMLDEFDKETVSQYVVSLFDNGINIKNLPNRTINELLDLGAIPIRSVIDYYRSKGYVSWDEIKGIIPIALSYSSQFNNLFDIIKLCSDGLNLVYKEYDTSKLLPFYSYLLRTEKLRLEELPINVVNQLFKERLISFETAFVYYQTYPETIDNQSRKQFWDGVLMIIDSLIFRKCYYDKITSLVNRDPNGFSTLFESIKLDVLFPYLEYLHAHNLFRKEIYQRLPNRYREYLFLQTIADGSPLDHRSEVCEYFTNYGTDTSLEMFCELFSRNYYYQFILSAFESTLENASKKSIIQIRECSTGNKAWEKATQIIMRAFPPNDNRSPLG